MTPLDKSNTITAPLTFEQLRRVNASRCARWHGPNWTDPSDPWTLADWSNAVCGEAGEAANIVKKLRHIQTSLWVPPTEAEVVLLAALADESADVALYLDLLTAKAGINLEHAIRHKFNRVSEAQGFEERL